jgi:hypothetical protein
MFDELLWIGFVVIFVSIALVLLVGNLMGDDDE